MILTVLFGVQALMKNGTYLIVRRVQMHLETWDRTSLKEQENTFGRHRDSGAPLGGQLMVIRWIWNSKMTRATL